MTVGVISDSVNQYNGGLVGIVRHRRLELHQSGRRAGRRPGRQRRTKAARCWRTSTTSPPGPAWPSTLRATCDLAMSQAVTALATTGEVEHHRRRRRLRRRADVPGRGDLAGDRHGRTADGVTYFSAAGNQGPTADICRSSAPPPAHLRHRLRHVHELQPQRRHDTLAADHDHRRNMPSSSSSSTSRTKLQEPAGDPGVGHVRRRHLCDQHRHRHRRGVEHRTTTTSRFRSPGQMLHDSDRRQLLHRRSSSFPAAIPGTSSSPTPTTPTSSRRSASNSAAPAARTTRRSVGHKATPNTIGVGATPWWAPAPYLGQNPLGSRAVQLVRPGSLRTERQRHCDGRRR